MVTLEALRGTDLWKLLYETGLSNRLSSLIAIFPVFEFRADDNPIVHHCFRKQWHAYNKNNAMRHRPRALHTL